MKADVVLVVVVTGDVDDEVEKCATKKSGPSTCLPMLYRLLRSFFQDRA